MIQIDGESDKALICQFGRDGLDLIIKSPPLVDEQYGGCWRFVRDGHEGRGLETG